MRKTLILGLCIFTLGAVKAREKACTVIGLVHHSGVSMARLVTSDSTYVSTIKNGSFSFTIPCIDEKYLSLRLDKSIPLYVKPCDSLVVDCDGNGTVHFSGRGVEESAFLQEKEYLIRKLGFDDPRKIDIALFSSGVDAFQVKIDSIKQVRFNQLNAYKSEHPALSESFYHIEEQLIDYFEMNQLFGYPDFYQMFTKKTPELPDGYYDFTGRIAFNKKELYSFDEYKSAINSYLNFKSKTLKGQYILAKTMLSDNELFNEIMFNKFVSYINFSGIDDLDSIYVDFVKGLKDDNRKKDLMGRYEDWKRLAKGEKAPDFAIEDDRGNLIHLSDFKGKYVYIDCWSSYCGPCIAEMPAMEALTDELRNRNIVFVTISADQDRERWLRKLKEYTINAIHLCTGGVKHKFNDDYKAKAFPRCILIDDKGLIIDATANKPSLIKEQLEQLTVSEHR